MPVDWPAGCFPWCGAAYKGPVVSTSQRTRTPRFQRARKPEEKDVRRRAILFAARDLAREVGPIALSLNEVARRSGISKPNLYRYFESREHILLSLLVQEIDEVVTSVEEVQGVRETDVSVVANALTHAYLSRPLLCQLLGMVASILEHNVSAEAIATSKGEMALHMLRAVEAMRSALPWLPQDDAAWATNTIALYVAGMWPAAHPSKIAAEVLARPGLAGMKPDAGADLARFIATLLTGIRALHRP
jgi:TetR/AcrR family transcriptional regulator